MDSAYKVSKRELSSLEQESVLTEDRRAPQHQSRIGWSGHSGSDVIVDTARMLPFLCVSYEFGGT